MPTMVAAVARRAPMKYVLLVQDRELREIGIVTAPWSIGLRPPRPGVEPGVWRAPEVLRAAGLAEALGAVEVVELPRPAYSPEPPPGTRIRNGLAIREHGLRLADAVAATLEADRLPVVVGGDCSVLLGSLAGARRHVDCALIHIDGHPDFVHPGNFDFSTAPGAAAGMDLALATGRGELLLTRWPGLDGQLVEDRQVVQFGDRTGGENLADSVLRIGVEEILDDLHAAVERTLGHLDGRPVWVHVDLDVLAADVLPAVDSPGSPGLSFAQLSEVLAKLRATDRVVGVDVAIYDPDLDPGHAHAPAIVECLAAGLGGTR